MGIDIINNVVHVTNEHNRLLNINKNINPTTIMIGSLFIYSIFQRLKSSERNPIGDNCSLLFALKNQKNLTTNIRSVKLLIPNFNYILEKIPNDYDILITMPSNYNIASILGKRVQKNNKSSQIINCFSKSNLISAEQEIKELQIDKRDKKIILNKISLQKNNKNTTISLKEIPTEFRKYLNPLTFNSIKNDLSNKRILLIDDLLATGTTLNSAKFIFENNFSNIKVDAITLFSSLI